MSSATLWAMGLLPSKTRSKLLFCVVMSAYSLAGSLSVMATLAALHLLRSRGGPLADSPQTGGGALLKVFGILVVSPVLETLVLVGLITILAKRRAPVALQLTVPSLFWCAVHSLIWPPWGLVVAPLFVASSYAYVHWRPVSFSAGLWTATLVHVLHNLLPSLLAGAQSRGGR